jgi:hypothetical protein
MAIEHMDKLDELIQKYPMLMNAVVPSLVIAVAMLTMATVMSLISLLVT